MEKSWLQEALAVDNKLDSYSFSLYLYLSGRCILSAQRWWELLLLWHFPQLPYSQRDLVSCVLVLVSIIPAYTPYRVKWVVQFLVLIPHLTLLRIQIIRLVFDITLLDLTHYPLTLPPMFLLYTHFPLARFPLH